MTFSERAIARPSWITALLNYFMIMVWHFVVTISKYAIIFHSRSAFLWWPSWKIVDICILDKHKCSQWILWPRKPNHKHHSSDILLRNCKDMCILRLVRTEFCGSHLGKWLTSTFWTNRNTSTVFLDPENLEKDAIFVIFCCSIFKLCALSVS